MPIHLSDLEQIVLLALLRLGPDAYGVPIGDEIASRTGREVSLGTIYKTLIRLEAKGLVSARLGSPTPERGGRRKRFYQLTPTGKKALAAALQAIHRLTAGVEHLLPEQP